MTIEEMEALQNEIGCMQLQLQRIRNRVGKGTSLAQTVGGGAIAVASRRH